MDWQQLQTMAYEYFALFVDALMWVVLQAPRIVLLYIVMVILLFWFLHSLRKSYSTVMWIFVSSVDAVLYRYTRAIVKAKDTLYDAENTLPLLFANKKRFLENEQPHYEEYLPDLKKDVIYLQDLLQEELIKEEDWIRFDSYQETAQRTSMMFTSVSAVLWILTLWISRFFTESLVR